MVDQVSLVLWRGVGMDWTNLGLAQTPMIFARTTCSNVYDTILLLTYWLPFFALFQLEEDFCGFTVPL